MHTPRCLQRLGRPDRVEIADTASRLYGCIRKATRNASKKEYCEGAQSVRRDVLSDPSMFPVEHILIILNNAINRDTDEASAIAFWEEGLAWTRAQYAVKRGELPQCPAQLHNVEEVAEGEAEVRETVWAHDPSPRNTELMIEAKRKHIVASERLISAVRPFVRSA